MPLGRQASLKTALVSEASWSGFESTHSLNLSQVCSSSWILGFTGATFHLASPSRTIQDQCHPLQSDFIPTTPSLLALNHISESLRIGLPIVVFNYYSYGSSDDKESACSAREQGLIPGSERSPGEGNGYPLQCSCLENSMEREPGELCSPWVRKESSQLNN